MASHKNNQIKHYFALIAAVGLIAWLALVASAGQDSEPKGAGLYGLVIFGAAFVLGLIRLGGPWITGLLLVLPALLLAAWTAPRGDEDGLWILIFPMLLIYIPVAAGIHYLGSRIRPYFKK